MADQKGGPEGRRGQGGAGRSQDRRSSGGSGQGASRGGSSRTGAGGPRTSGPGKSAPRPGGSGGGSRAGGSGRSTAGQGSPRASSSAPRTGGDSGEGGSRSGAPRTRSSGPGSRGPQGSGGRSGGSRAGGPKDGRSRTGDRKSSAPRGSGGGGRSDRGTSGRRPSDEPSRPPRAPGPPVPDDVTGTELERYVLAELRSLPDTLAIKVGKHLVMVGRLLDDDPEEALPHAQAARDLAPRVALLRETLGVCAYRSGDFATALTELKAARRISGGDEFLPLIADCERGLGRPQKALEIVNSAPKRLPAEVAVELLIVAAGARRDMGDAEAAVLQLQRPELKTTTDEPWSARLRYAYADALLAAGRRTEAATWFGRAAAADLEGLTDAEERLVALVEDE